MLYRYIYFILPFIFLIVFISGSLSYATSADTESTIIIKYSNSTLLEILDKLGSAHDTTIILSGSQPDTVRSIDITSYSIRKSIEDILKIYGVHNYAMMATADNEYKIHIFNYYPTPNIEDNTSSLITPNKIQKLLAAGSPDSFSSSEHPKSITPSEAERLQSLGSPDDINFPSYNASTKSLTSDEIDRLIKKGSPDGNKSTVENQHITQDEALRLQMMPNPDTNGVHENHNAQSINQNKIDKLLQNDSPD